MAEHHGMVLKYARVERYRCCSLSGRSEVVLMASKRGLAWAIVIVVIQMQFRGEGRHGDSFAVRKQMSKLNGPHILRAIQDRQELSVLVCLGK